MNSYNGLRGDPKGGTFFILQLYERAGISQVVVQCIESVGKSVISVC